MARVLCILWLGSAVFGLTNSQGFFASGGGGGLGPGGNFAVPPGSMPQTTHVGASALAAQQAGGFNAMNSNSFGNGMAGPMDTLRGPGGGLGMGGMQGLGGMGGVGGMSGLGGMGGVSGLGGMGGDPSGGGASQYGGGDSGYGGSAGGGYGGGSAGGYGGDSGASGGGYGNSGGSGYGGDNGASIPNAGYGGYPGRGGFSGYWEPGVKPVPLALQGWGLFIPRPPVEITTPTTVATTTPRPATVAPTLAPTTAAPTTTTTTTTTAKPTTTVAYGGSYGSYSGSSSNTANKNLPDMFQVNGKKVMVMQVDDNDAAFGTLFSGPNKAADATALKSPISSENDQAVDPPKSCVPTNTPTAKGVCVDESLVQIACPNMIISQAAVCRKDQFCCFVD